MAVKKRDFQKIAQMVQDFLGKLSCEEGTAELRDALNLTLLYMQKYYKTLRSRSQSNTNGISPRCVGGTLLFTSSCGAISPVSPACGLPDIFEWKWFNIESPKLSASLGTDEFSMLSNVLQATKAGDLEAVKDLIEKDPKCVESNDGLGRNAVMYAVHGKSDPHTECLEVLLEAGSNVDHQANDKSTALHVAAHETNSAALSLLLKYKASCNIEDHEGRTPLHWASGNSSLDNLKLLLQHGANINALDCEGLTAAMWACHYDQKHNLSTLKTALSRFDPREEALFEQQDVKGRTVVHWAVNRSTSLECLKELLTKETGKLLDGENRSILHTAAEQGCLAACELVLDVSGCDCLNLIDNQGRTPLHLAALCGQAQIINYLLDVGADLLCEDRSGATPVDYIKNKQLIYSMMVLSLHPQYQRLLNTEQSNHNISMEILPPSIAGPRLHAFAHKPNDRATPSAPPEEDFLQRHESPDVPQEDHVDEVDGNVDASVFDESGGRKHSDPRPPRPLPRKHRHEGVSGDRENTEEDGGANGSPRGGGDTKRPPYVTRRHSLLTRQGGVQEDHAADDILDDSQDNGDVELDAAKFDMRTTDGDVVVLMDDLDSLQVSPDIEEVIDGNPVVDEEEEFGYTTARLQQGKGSASSEHSDPDHADNFSVSVGLSVSSLGSGSDDEVMRNDGRDHVKDTSPKQQEKVRIPAPTMTQGWSSPTPQSLGPARSPRPPPQSPRAPMSNNDERVHPKGPMVPEPLGASDPQPRRKKDKKKKQKKSPIAEIPPPRGFVAPLESPGFRQAPGAKLGGLDPVKAPPWEHAGLGVLRRGSPESSPPGGKMMEASRFWPPGYYPADELEIAISDEEGYMDEVDYGRPRTPEPARSPRDIITKGAFHPAPPGRGPVDDRATVYGPWGPSHGPLAHKNGQALLRNTDMGAMRVSPPNKLDPRGGLSSLPRSPRGPGAQSGFGLPQSPVPHPPPK